MTLAGMVKRPYGGFERAGKFSPMKDHSINKTIHRLQIYLYDKFTYDFWFILIRWDYLLITLFIYIILPTRVFCLYDTRALNVGHTVP